jgi:hypothetical protein
MALTKKRQLPNCRLSCRQVALAFAQRHPEAVASLSLYEPIVLGLLGHNDLGPAPSARPGAG